LNYAHRDNGATIASSGHDGSRGADSLINGVVAPAAWSEGEGWEYTFERTERRRREGPGLYGVEGRIDQGAAWAHITFAEPSVINRVVVRAMDTLEMPFAGYKAAYLQAYDSKDSFSPWKTVARVEQGKVLVPGRQSARSGPVTTFRFNPVTAESIRFIVFAMLDSKALPTQYTAYEEEPDRRNQTGRRRGGEFLHAQETTVRLLEIEVTGTKGVTLDTMSTPVDGSAASTPGTDDAR
jgi:hypothetical protein